MTFLLSLTVTVEARAETPFTAWAEGSGRAAAAIAAGDAAGALSAASSIPIFTTGAWSARTALLEARALELDHRHDQAAARIASVVDSLPVTIRAPARARLASDLLAAGHPAEAAAAAALARREGDPTLAPALATAEARAWLAAGQPGEAARAADAGGNDPGARLALATAWLRLGDPRAPTSLRTLAIERAGEPEGEAAASLLASLPGSLSAADRLERARRLLAGGRSSLAHAELDALDPVLAEAPLPAVLRSMAHLQSGRPSEAERVAAPVARLPGPGEPAAARYVLARAAVRQGRIDEAITRYRQVARERPVVPGLSAAQQADLADDAAFLAAWLPHDLGRNAEAASQIRRFLREHPTARRAPDARWFLAWTLLRSGNRDGARKALRDVASRETGNLRAAALYWLGRTEAGPGALRAAEANYREAAAEVPGGWYALLATARLSQLPAAPPADEPVPPSPLPGPPRDPGQAAALALAIDLAAVGLAEESRALLQRLSRAPDVRGRAALLAEVASFCGDVEVPYRMARDHLPAGVRSRRWSYPDALPGLLRPAASRLGVDPELALAVMRRESAFVAGARSTAGAEGLLQLRPATAARLRAIADIPGAADLSDPAENAILGLAYLGLLADRFPSPAQLLAAYNAGPVAATAWSRERAGLPLDEWVEEIPYRETRNYVRGVIADWFRYLRLSSMPLPSLDPSSPVNPPGSGVAF